MMVKSKMIFVAIIAYTLFYGILPVMVQMPTCTKTASGICCEFTSSTYCCPHPLVPKSEAKCCVGDSDHCCTLSNIHLHPLPRCCDSNGHCCPVPSVPEDGTSKCCNLNNNGAKTCCELPELPSGDCCMRPGIPAAVPDIDEPQYQLYRSIYSMIMKSIALTGVSDYLNF